MRYANVRVQGHGSEGLATEMDAEMARWASDGWRVVAVTALGRDGWGNASVIVTFEKPTPFSPA